MKNKSFVKALIRTVGEGLCRLKKTLTMEYFAYAKTSWFP